MAQVGFRLEAAASVSARIPLAADVPAEVRDAVEAQVGSIRLSRDVFYGEDEIGFRLGVAPDTAGLRPDAPLTVSLRTESGEVVHELEPAAAGQVALCRGDELPDGHYELLCSWAAADGRPLTAVSFAIHKLTPVPPLPGYERLAERKRLALTHYAGFQRAEQRPDIWREVARYALGRYGDVDEGVIRDTCQFIAARKDCADFVIQAILRLMCWERETPRSARKSTR